MFPLRMETFIHFVFITFTMLRCGDVRLRQKKTNSQLCAITNFNRISCLFNIDDSKRFLWSLSLNTSHEGMDIRKEQLFSPMFFFHIHSVNTESNVTNIRNDSQKKKGNCLFGMFALSKTTRKMYVSKKGIFQTFRRFHCFTFSIFLFFTNISCNSWWWILLKVTVNSQNVGDVFLAI